MFTRLVELLRVKDSNLDLGDQSAASFRLNEPGSPYDVLRLRTARGTRTLITAGLSRGPLPVGLERRGHHEDSNPVLLVTKEVFYLSNSGAKRNLPINSRSNPLLHIAVPVRTVGIEPTTPDWKSGMFPLHHVHEAELAGVEPAASRASTGRSSP